MNKLLKTVLVAFAGCLPLLSSCNPLEPKFSAHLNYSGEIISVDMTKYLNVNVYYYNDIVLRDKYSTSWISNDPNVVEVDKSGAVTGVGIGTTDVVAKITFFNSAYSPITTSCKFTVIDENPISLNLNKSEVNIQPGKSLKLIANVEHSINKKAIWSSDSSLVNVDQNGLVSVPESTPIGTIANITAVSEADENAFDTCVVNVSDVPMKKYDYTIMFYMSGSSLEYNPEEYRNSFYRASKVLPGLFSIDIKEILSVNLPDSVKVIIQTGGSKKWALESAYIDGATSISNTNLQRWEVSNHKLKLISTYKNNKMAHEESFKDFLKWGISDYDAEQMAVIISGHGAGLGGCAVDDNYTYVQDGYEYENTLNCEEIASAVKGAFSATGLDKMTWIGFDCCLMQSADMASVLADYFDYMVASQENEIGEGWDHDVYMKLMVENPSVKPEVLLPKICESFVKFGHNTYCEMDDPCYSTLSALDLRKMNTFTNAFNNYVAQTKSGSSQYNKYKTAFLSSYKFGDDYYGLVDFKNYLQKLKSQFTKVSIDEVISALDDVVIANYYCSRYSIEPCGFNAFFPYSIDDKYGLQVGRDDYNSACSKFSAYQKMCYDYGSWYF